MLKLSLLLAVAVFTVCSADGDDMCDTQRLHDNDYINQRFMTGHICLLKGAAPSNAKARASFCDDFRNLDLYQVMMLSNKELKALRKEIKAHQDDFEADEAHWPPLLLGPSTRHYTTAGTYSFIECKNGKGKSLPKRYMQYIPKGPEGNAKVYQMYHGCPPIKDSPGFRNVGNC